MRAESAEIAVALDPMQRRYLRGQAIFCALGAIITAMIALFLLGILLPSFKRDGNILNLLLLLVPVGFCVMLIVFGLQYLRDLLSGNAICRQDRLLEIIRRRGRLYLFEKLGGLQPPTRPDFQVVPLREDLGTVLQITYSPRSRTLWKVEMARLKSGARGA